jgi:hypothetical protein
LSFHLNCDENPATSVFHCQFYISFLKLYFVFRYQAPGAYDAFWKSSEGTEKNKHSGPTARKSMKGGVSAEQFAAMGLRTGTGHKQTSGKQKQKLEPIAHVDIPDTSIKEESKDEPESELMILP